MRVIGIIPARYSSSRFPGKALADISGKPMIQRVYEQVVKASGLQDVIVATDSDEIFRRVEDFGGKAVMTSSDCKSGTDRIAEAVKDIECDIVVNVQGDEPLISPEVINLAVNPLIEDKNIQMGTVASRITEKNELDDHNVAKVVIDKDSFALYFSRAIVPCSKNRTLDVQKHLYYKHIGIYVYRRDFLLRFAGMSQTPLEEIEGLEQLRALENGCRIKVIITNYSSVSVDVPEDIEKVNRIIKKKTV